MARWSDANRKPLAIIRANAGFSAEKAAALLGIAMLRLYRYENGIVDLPVSLAEKMTLLYNVPFDEIRIAVKNTERIKNDKQR